MYPAMCVCRGNLAWPSNSPAILTRTEHVQRKRGPPTARRPKSRLDNLAGCYANIAAFTKAKPARTVVLALFNHEETGSKSGEGAESDFLSSIVRRLVIAKGGDAEDAMVGAARSLILRRAPQTGETAATHEERE